MVSAEKENITNNKSIIDQPKEELGDNKSLYSHVYADNNLRIRSIKKATQFLLLLSHAEKAGFFLYWDLCEHGGRLFGDTRLGRNYIFQQKNKKSNKQINLMEQKKDRKIIVSKLNEFGMIKIKGDWIFPMISEVYLDIHPNANVISLRGSPSIQNFLSRSMPNISTGKSEKIQEILKKRRKNYYFPFPTSGLHW